MYQITVKQIDNGFVAAYFDPAPTPSNDGEVFAQNPEDAFKAALKAVEAGRAS